VLCVLHLTDTHIVATEDDPATPKSFAGAVAQVQGRTTTETLRAVLAAVADAGIVPDLVLHTGDVADDGAAESYAAIRDVLAEVGAPAIVVPGNHDDHMALAAALDQDPAAVRWVDLGGWRILAIDSAIPDEDHGSLSETTLAAVDAALEAAPGPVLIGVHHPPHSVCPDPSCRLEEAPELVEILSRHPGVRAVVSGHLHVTEEHEHDGILYLLSPSTALQLRHEHPLPEHNDAPTPVGARVVELHDDGTVTSDVIWTTASGQRA
jgi:Icc protein